MAAAVQPYTKTCGIAAAFVPRICHANMRCGPCSSCCTRSDIAAAAPALSDAAERSPPASAAPPGCRSLQCSPACKRRQSSAPSFSSCSRRPAPRNSARPQPLARCMHRRGPAPASPCITAAPGCWPPPPGAAWPHTACCTRAGPRLRAAAAPTSRGVRTVTAACGVAAPSWCSPCKQQPGGSRPAAGAASQAARGQRRAGSGRLAGAAHIRTLVQDGAQHLRLAARLNLLVQARQRHLPGGQVQQAQRAAVRRLLLAAERQPRRGGGCRRRGHLGRHDPADVPLARRGGREGESCLHVGWGLQLTTQGRRRWRRRWRLRAGGEVPAAPLQHPGGAARQHGRPGARLPSRSRLGAL